jgi:hypothetical protein
MRPPPGASIPRPEQSRLSDPDYEVEPWYWIGDSDVEKLPDLSDKQWFLAFRDVTNTTAERTFVGTILPRSAVNHKAPLLLSSREPNFFIGLIANMSSLILDFVARQKVSGSSLGRGLRANHCAVRSTKALYVPPLPHARLLLAQAGKPWR